MERIDSSSKNEIYEKISKLSQIIPECISEGKIDFEKFKSLFKEFVDDSNEHFGLMWNGKNRALQISQSLSTNILRPVENKSVNWDNTENVYIEGDNLEVLKILQKSYNRKVKMIYIDPPYNTGNDFVYNDSFNDTLNNYVEQTNQENKANPETSGRFHTEWLNMMYPRLRLAKNLLSDDGVIFISIDDSEIENLKEICNEIFGGRNFVANIIWERAFSPINLKKHFSESHDFALVYAKNIDNLVCNGLKRKDESNDRYKNLDNDPRGPWSSSDLSVGPAIQSNIYEITTPSGRKVMPPSGYSWRLNEETFNNYKEDNRIWFGPNGDNVPRIKRFLSEVKQSITPMTIWKYEDVGHSQSASQYLKKLFDGKAYFDYPKPVDYIKRMIELYTSDDDIVLDFFSGSATTAEAVMKLNVEDEGKRRFIMVQLPELYSKDSVAYKDGYKTICDVGEERIRRAGAKIKEENGILAQNLDTGFKVFKLDSSNIKLWNGDNLDINNANEYFYEHMDPIVEGRTEEDLLYEILIKEGMMLSSPIEEKLINNKKIYSIGMGYMIVCLNDDIDIDLVREIGKLNPETVIFKDSGFVDENAKANALQELKKLGIEEEKVKSI